MRLSNRSKTPVYNFINTLLLMIVFGGIVAFFFDRYKLKIFGWESSLFLVVPALLLLIYYYRGKHIFEYDSDGETLIFKNRSIIPLLQKPINDEFPKYKLRSYEIFNGIFFKRLYVTVDSKKNHTIVLRYDISYLTRREIKDLKFSLSKATRVARKIIENNIIEE